MKAVLSIPCALRRAFSPDIWLVLTAVLLLSAPALPAAAQTLSAGVLQGTVLDSLGAPLYNVTVTITSRSNGQRSTVRTDHEGLYASELLTPGHYDALFERLGFVPERVEDVLVVAGGRRNLGVTLNLAHGPVQSRRTRAPNALLSLSGPSAPDHWLVSGANIAAMPFDGLGLNGLFHTASLAGAHHDVAGLPGSMSGLVVDGVPLVQRGRRFEQFMHQASLPLAWLGQVGLEINNADVEYPGAAGGYIIGHSRRGGREAGLSAFGDYAGSSLVSGAADLPSFTGYRAGGLLEGPIVRDTASFVAGGEVLRSRTPFNAFWTADAQSAMAAKAALDHSSIALTRYTQPDAAVLDRESVFGRMDLRLGDNTTISGRGFFAQTPEPEPVAPWTETALRSPITGRQREILGTATLVTRLEDRYTGELSAGFESSHNGQRPSADRHNALPATTIVSAGRSFGSSDNADFDAQLSSLYVRGMLHIRSGAHWRKIGISASLPSYHVPDVVDRAGEFTFADTADLASGFGYFRRVNGAVNRADFKMRRVGIMAQDVWRPNPGLEVLAAGRITSFRLPDSSNIDPSPEWSRLAAMSNRSTGGRQVEFEPRFVITLTPGGREDWQMRTGVMVDADMPDPAYVAEVVSNHGTATSRVGYGSLGVWPKLPVTAAAPINGFVLSVIGPKYQGPRTTRAFGSLTRLFGAQGGLTVEFDYRRTEFLPERIDLNLTPSVTGHDQFGRPLFGQLDKRGAMLTASRGSNRRFDTFDQVWGIQSTAESRYTGFTVILERPLNGALALYGSYTYSRTNDNWLSGAPGDPYSQLTPFPDSALETDWKDGRSDFDVPNRATLGAELHLPGALSPSVAALFRYQSGYPFTPGFRPGVDANGDGSSSNDPAFIDGSVSGMSELLAKWPCLQADQGTYATRNSCRTPNLLSLDGRFSMTFHSTARYAASLVVDALHLIATKDGEPDRAVYLLDPAANLSVDGSGNVTVPLVANPDFGQLVTRFTAERQLRLGLRVSF